TVFLVVAFFFVAFFFVAFFAAPRAFAAAFLVAFLAALRFFAVAFFVPFFGALRPFAAVFFPVLRALVAAFLPDDFVLPDPVRVFLPDFFVVPADLVAFLALPFFVLDFFLPTREVLLFDLAAELDALRADLAAEPVFVVFFEPFDFFAAAIVLTP
ncbi:MAG: hypothetical protein AAFV32_07975, partial [Myxococcota bacterium]